MKKLIAIFVLLAAAAGGSYWYINYGKPKEKPQVMTAAVSRQDIVEAVQATGTLEAVRLVPVGSQVSGTVDNLYGVDYNTIVHKGQKIAHIDDSLLQVQVDIQKANLERQHGDIDQTNVQLENDQLNLERQRKMQAAGLVNQQALEQAELTVKSRKASIASALKQLKQTEAALNQAQLNVNYCTITAPVDGVVVERKVDIGQAVQSSMNVAQFFTIATDLTNLKLTASVDEAEIGKIRRFMPVQFQVESYGPQIFSGTVDAVRLNATTNNNVVTYPVWITVPNNDLKLRPSMTATLRIIISTAEAAVRVPNAALRFKPNADTYTGLGLTPPGPGQGGRAAGAGNAQNGDTRGGQGANAQPGAAPAPNAPGAPSAPAAGTAPAPTPDAQLAQNAPQDQQQRQPGQTGGRGGGGRGGAGGGGGRTRNSGGFGAGAGNQMTSQQMMQALQSGRGGRGGGGRNGAPANASGDTTPLTERKTADGKTADKIDELFQETPHKTDPNTVWTWDEAKKELKSIRITTGVSDGQFTELVRGDLTVGQLLVTNVILPVTSKPGAAGANPFMQQPGRGNPGGSMMPGGAGGGGGGGGRGGGGGGGGRGGN